MLCPWPWKYTIADYPIGKSSPPAFIASARDDRTAPTAFAEAIAEAYRKQGVPVYLWQIDEGGHMAFSEPSTGTGSGWDKVFWKGPR